jgi:hypothetical protein
VVIPRYSILSFPNTSENTTKIRSGKKIVKNAEIGVRQKILHS